MSILSGAKILVGLGRTFVIAYRPELLLGASLTATAATGVLAAKGGYEARGIVDSAEANQRARIESGEQGVNPTLTLKEKANLTWHCYWPAAAASLTAMGTTTALHIVHVKEKKALAAAALMAIDEVKQDAQEQIEKLTGPLTPEQQQKALEEKDKKKTGEVKVQNTDGEVEELFLVRDPETHRDIWSNRARIEEAMAETAAMVNGSDCASVNNFFEKAGYGRTRRGEELGWSGALPSVSWADENGLPIAGVRDDGRPYRGFRFLPTPTQGYDDPHR